MSVFLRTNSGLDNQHAFFGVDYVLYTEGGKESYTLEDVINGEHSTDTDDSIYWANIFDSLNSNNSIKIKSIGSKTALKSLADKIINDKLNTLLIAMDNEFDEFYNRRINHDQVIYTYGYSWENDIWSVDLICDTIYSVSAIKPNKPDISNIFDDFVRKIKIAVKADAYLFASGKSFFPRKNGWLFCVNCKPAYLPEIKTELIFAKVEEKGITNEHLAIISINDEAEILKYCFGHFLADYCFQIIHNYLKNIHNLHGLKNCFLARIALKLYFEKYFNNSSKKEYFSYQLRRLSNLSSRIA